MINDIDCPRANDANTPCYLKDGDSALFGIAGETDQRCNGCRWTVPDITRDATKRANPDAKQVGMLLSISGVHSQEKVTLDGHDITNLLRGIDISARPGELLDVQLRLLLNVFPAVEIPETLMNVSVIDDGRSLILEQAMAELLGELAGMDAELFPADVCETISRAKKIMGEERVDDRPDTVAERLRKRW